jgi:hypothetical protein
MIININQILISQPIINKVNKNDDKMIYYLSKFKKLFNIRTPELTNQTKKCFNINNRRISPGYSLVRDIPHNVTKSIEVGECYTENGSKMLSKGHQLYYILDGRHRMVRHILDYNKKIDVIINN